jgi:hypothetical protein
LIKELENLKVLDELEKGLNELDLTPQEKIMWRKVIKDRKKTEVNRYIAKQASIMMLDDPQIN